jgi:hypothetical protein
VLLHCSLLKNPWPKSTGVLEDCREEETKLVLHFSGCFLYHIPKAMNDINVLSLFTVLPSGMNPYPGSQNFMWMITWDSGDFFYLLHISILFHLIHPSFPWFSFFPCSIQCSRCNFFVAFVVFAFFLHDHSVLVGGCL